jgi:hypothetical protein
MALEPAGVSLEAEGFQKYLKQLEQIDKKQQETFDTKFKGTGRTFAQVTKAAKAYEKELNALAKAERRARDEAEKLAQQQKIVAATQRQAALSTLGVVGAAATSGIRASIEFSKESLRLARIQAKAEAQLATAIRSTGGAAELSSRELKNLAGELQGLTNFGDEATIQAEALLLTFTSIGRETFPRALKSILDVSTAMDQDLSTSVLQVGKALNDPIQGVSALTRAGIQFTSQQKEQISALQESGRLFEAQAIILGELEKQFGGSAEAAREADGGVIALGNSFGDLQEQVGLLIQDLNKASGATDFLGKELDETTSFLRGLRAQFGFGDISDEIAGLENQINALEELRARSAAEDQPIFVDFLRTVGILDQQNAIEGFDNALENLRAELGQLNLQATAEDEEELAKATANANASLQNQEQAIENDEAAIKALNQAVQQAEQLQLSFGRAAEDAARQLARQQEDVARNTNRQVGRLNEQQAKDQAKLLDDQIKELERFDEDRRKQIASAEKDIAKAQKKAEDDVKKARDEAARDRIRAQEKLQRELKQAQDRFNLSQLQSERRFQLSEKRLRAEGDILGLQQLREDQELAQQEEKENFALSQKETKDNAKDQAKDQGQELEDRVRQINQDAKERLNDLKANLEQQRGELLANFDQQIADQMQAQEEARLEQQRGFDEQAEDRAIALQRAEEDRRISEQRQLEDLGRSLASQKDITEEGVTAIAGEIEKIFGQEG